MSRRGMTGKKGFSLIELLVVIALVALLAALQLPALIGARERARVTRVHVELRQIEVALEAYCDDHTAYPPVRVSCNTADRDHWCQLPPELVVSGYLAPGRRAGMASAMADPFHADHTYKYAAIGPYFLNGALQEESFGMFVPDDFPDCKALSGRYWEEPGAPLAWAVWSLGPNPSGEKALHPRAPVSASTWYTATGDHGVIARMKPRNGSSFSTP